VEIEDIRWLVTDQGRQLVTAVTRELDAGQDELAVLQHLRQRGHDVARAALVMDAAHARRRARDRWPDADELILLGTALEQASDPAVAAWRAQRFRRASVGVADLCAGIGGDALAIAAAGVPVHAVDLDGGRLELLRHNAGVRGLSITTELADARTVELPPGTWVHADPGRRDERGRIRRLGRYVPPVPALIAAHPHAPGMGIAVSPAIDLDDPDLPEAELEFIQIGPRLVEAMLWRGEARAPQVASSATLLPDGHHLTRVGPPVPLRTGPPGDLLLSVAPAAVRARLHDDLAERFGAWRLTAARALLTSDGPPPPSPWLVARRIEQVLPVAPRRIRSWLRTVDDLPLEIALHGVDGDPTRWWRELGRPPRGPQGRRIDLVRTDDGAIAVASRPLSLDGREQ